MCPGHDCSDYGGTDRESGPDSGSIYWRCNDAALVELPGHSMWRHSMAVVAYMRLKER
jgi:hypothetical protein